MQKTTKTYAIKRQEQCKINKHFIQPSRRRRC